MWLARELLLDPDLQEDLLMKKNGEFEHDDHEFKELNTGQWWHDTEEAELPEVTNNYVIYNRTVRVKTMLNFRELCCYP